MHIGKTLKELRQAQGMKLKELAEKSGVQIATLSRIEHHKMTGTLESHIAVAKALGLDITQLYSAVMQDQRKAELKKPEAKSEMFVHSDKSSYEILTSKVLAKKMMPILLKVEPGGRTNTEQNQPGAEKFVFVLDGMIEIKVGKETYALSKNNTLYFDASLPHQCTNKGKNTAKVLCVGTPVAL